MLSRLGPNHPVQRAFPERKIQENPIHAPQAERAAGRFTPIADRLQFGLAEKPLETLDLSGEWHYLPYNDAGWVNVPALTEQMQAAPTMKLPSNWFLMGKKDYPARASANPLPMDMFYDRNYLKDRGLDHAGTVWFTRDFNWKPGSGPAILDLDMVDYYANVYVNGQEAGKHEGYFQKWSLDVTPFLHKDPSKPNRIAIRISSPEGAYDPSSLYPIGWPYQRNQIKGIFDYHDTRPGSRTMRGQERNTGGLIRGVAIRRSSGLDMANLRVTPLEVSEASARLQIEATLQNWTGKPFKAKAQGEVQPANFESDVRIPVEFEVNAQPGVTKIKTEIKMDKPALWWSWDLGKPNLYTLNLSLRSPDDQLLHQASKRFGVRSIEVNQNWQMFLNGKRVYPRGSNYIATQWLSQADRDWYDQDLKLAREANLNAIRVHAHLEKPEFYEAADEAGMLVWQDFPLIWGYAADETFRNEAIKQAGDMVDRFGSHPSIAMWSMHNEAPHDDNPAIPNINGHENQVMDDALTARVKEMDPSRFVHRDSGRGDGHPYHGWYEGQLTDFEKEYVPDAPDAWSTKQNAPCVSEYGAQGMPGLAGLKRIFGRFRNIWPLNADNLRLMRSACFLPKQNFQRGGVQPGYSLDDLIANSQRFQANSIRYTTELMRRNKGTNRAGGSGIYHFMLTDCAPAITWSVLDYDRQPKPGFFTLKKVMQPLLPSIAYNVHDPKKPLALHIVNDFQQQFNGAKLEWRIRNGDEILKQGSHPVDIAPDSAARIVDLGVVPEVTEGTAVLEVSILDAQGKTLASNDLSARDFMPPPPDPHKGYPQDPEFVKLWSDPLPD